MGTPIRQREEHPAWFFKVLFLSSLIFLGVLSHPTPGLADEALELFNQAHTQIQQGHYEKASKSLTTAIELFPRFAEAHHLLGVVYFTGLNQPNKALASFKHAIAYYNLGVFYEFHRNDTQKALAHYHEYVKQGGADDRITNLLKKTR